MITMAIEILKKFGFLIGEILNVVWPLTYEINAHYYEIVAFFFVLSVGTVILLRILQGKSQRKVEK